MTEPESEISEAWPWWSWIFDSIGPSCCPTHFLGFTRFPIFLKKNTQGLVCFWVNRDIKSGFFGHVTNIQTWQKKSGHVGVIFGQCFQAEIPVSLYLFHAWNLCSPWTNWWSLKQSPHLFEEHGKDEDEGYGLYVLTRRSLGLMADVVGIFKVFPCFLRIKWHRWRQIWSHLPCGLDNFWPLLRWRDMFSEWQQEVLNSGPLWGHNFNPSACFFCGEDGLRGSGVSEHQPGWWWNSGRTWGRHCREDVRVERKSLGWDVKLKHFFLWVLVFYFCVFICFCCCFLLLSLLLLLLLLVTCMPVWYAVGIFFWFLYTTLIHLHYIHVCVLYNIPNSTYKSGDLF